MRSIRRLLAVLAGVLLALGLLEASLRLVDQQGVTYWDSSKFRRLLSTTPHFVENIPNAQSTFLGVPVSINELGLRGPHINLAKPPGTFRILVVGDSITFGYGVRSTEAYPSLLESVLNGKCHGTSYEVLNGATLGGGLGDYLHFLKTKADELQPDLLIVGVAINDILPYTESGATGEYDTTPILPQTLRLQRLNRSLMTHSHLYSFIYARIKSVAYAARFIDMDQAQGWNLVALREPSEPQLAAWDKTDVMLSKVIAFGSARHLPVLVVSFPLRLQMSVDQLDYYRKKYGLKISASAVSGSPQRRLDDISARQGARFLDMLPIVRRYEPEAVFFHNDRITDDASHLSPLGHLITAEAIRDTLRDVCRPLEIN
jgi:hypothetical protein